MVKTSSVKSVSKDSIYWRSLLPKLQLSVSSVLRAKLYAKEEMKLVQMSTIGGKVIWQMSFCHVCVQMFVRVFIYSLRLKIRLRGGTNLQVIVKRATMEHFVQLVCQDMLLSPNIHALNVVKKPATFLKWQV
jgi:hypothetical protein